MRATRARRGGTVRESSQPAGVRPRRLTHAPDLGSRSSHAWPTRRLTCRPLRSRHFASKYAPSPSFEGTTTMAGATTLMVAEASASGGREYHENGREYQRGEGVPEGVPNAPNRLPSRAVASPQVARNSAFQTAFIGLITRRSRVRIPPPLFTEASRLRGFCCSGGRCGWVWGNVGAEIVAHTAHCQGCPRPTPMRRPVTALPNDHDRRSAEGLAASGDDHARRGLRALGLVGANCGTEREDLAAMTSEPRDKGPEVLCWSAIDGAGEGSRASASSARPGGSSREGVVVSAAWG